MDQPHRFTRRQALATGQHLIERLAFKTFHDEKMNRLVLAGFKRTGRRWDASANRQGGLHAGNRGQRQPILGRDGGGNTLIATTCPDGCTDCTPLPCGGGNPLQDLVIAEEEVIGVARATTCWPRYSGTYCLPTIHLRTPALAWRPPWLPPAKGRSRIASISLVGHHAYAADEEATDVFDFEPTGARSQGSGVRGQERSYLRA